MAELDVAARIADALSLQRRRITTFEIDKSAHPRDFNDAVRIYGQLLQVARGVVKDSIRYSRSLTPEQRREVIVGWFKSLPLNQQRVLLEELHKTFQLRAV